MDLGESVRSLALSAYHFEFLDGGRSYPKRSTNKPETQHPFHYG